MICATHSDTVVFNLSQVCMHFILSLSVLEELAKREKRCSLEEEFGYHASSTKTIHGFCHFAISLSLQFTCGYLEFLRANLWVVRGRVKTFWSDITRPASRSVKEKWEVGWVVERQISRFVGGKVGEVYPIPRRYQYILRFYIPMRYLTVTSITHSIKQLEGNPPLLDHSKERSCASQISTTITIHVMLHTWCDHRDCLQSIVELCSQPFPFLRRLGNCRHWVCRREPPSQLLYQMRSE